MASNSFFSAPRNRSSSVPSCRWPVACHSDQSLLLNAGCSHSCKRFTSRTARLLARPSRHSIAFAARLRLTLATAVSAKSPVGLSHQLPARQACPFGCARRVAGASSRHSRFSRPHCAARANHSVNRTPGKLRSPVPSAVPASVAGYLERWGCLFLHSTHRKVHT
jgi:hypothetical protein